LTAGQRTGNNALRYYESEMGGPQMDARFDEQGSQFTRAVLDRAGIQADRATPDVIDGALNRIGSQFNVLASRNSLTPDAQLANDVGAATQYYNQRVNTPNRAPLVNDYRNEIINAVGAGGQIPGTVYQSLRSRIAADARSASDQYVQRTLNDM